MYSNYAKRPSSKPEHIDIIGPCRVCDELVTLDNVPLLQYEAWRSGTNIQIAMPQLDADSREFLISGTCGSCWDAMFSGYAEEDEPERTGNECDECGATCVEVERVWGCPRCDYGMDLEHDGQPDELQEWLDFDPEC